MSSFRLYCQSCHSGLHFVPLLKSDRRIHSSMVQTSNGSRCGRAAPLPDISRTFGALELFFSTLRNWYVESQKSISNKFQSGKDKLEDMDISLDNIWLLGIWLVANTSSLNISKDPIIMYLLSYYKNLDVGGHLQLVSCLHVNWSPNDSPLKKLSRKLFLTPGIYCHFLKNVKTHPTLNKSHYQTIRPSMYFKVSLERQYPDLSFGTQGSDACPMVWL